MLGLESINHTIFWTGKESLMICALDCNTILIALLKKAYLLSKCKYFQKLFCFLMMSCISKKKWAGPSMPPRGAPYVLCKVDWKKSTSYNE